MRKKCIKSKKGDKPVKGIKHHGIRSTIFFVLIVAAVLWLISHPGQVIFGLFSAIGWILSMSFGSIVVLAIIGFFVYIFIAFK